MVHEPGILDEEDSPEPPTKEGATALAEKLSALKARCEAANIEFSQRKDEDGDVYATLSIQDGSSKRRLSVFSKDRASALLAVKFEKYRFLAGYEAICSYEENVIEAGLRGTRFGSLFILRRLQGLPGHGAESELKTVAIPPPEQLSGRPTIEIGPCSPEFVALRGKLGSQISLKLKGVRVAQHDQALAELRSVADSLFFQIDMMYGSAFTLERGRRTRVPLTPRRTTDRQLAYPSSQYNHEAMSLYWYAQSARDMPLLRFLAFYQSIEYYFPRYSQTEARRRISVILKRPTFRPHRDDDLDRLISVVQTARGGGFGSEKAQLRSVLNECIGSDEMREYLTEYSEREAHFSGRASKTKYHKIPLANKNADLRNDVADRIYDIRCKIVHTKNESADDDFRMLLPFSEDADYILHDIDLIEFVARRVLIASSSELS